MTVRPALQVQVAVLPHGRGLPLPAAASEEAAGLDLRAAVEEALELAPGAWTLIPTGLRLALPSGYEGQLRPRSGLALRYGVTLLNAPGTLDADYRGELGIILINHGARPFLVERGMRIAQLVVAPVVRVQLRETEELPPSQRGGGGFGSSGVD